MSWFNNQPLCPALVNNVDRVTILEYSDDRLQTVTNTWNTVKPFSVVLYAYGATEAWLDSVAEKTEAEYPEIAVLWVHPAAPRYIRDHVTPNPGVPILILQSRSDLIAEKARLKQTDYYKNWH